MSGDPKKAVHSPSVHSNKKTDTLRKAFTTRLHKVSFGLILPVGLTTDFQTDHPFLKEKTTNNGTSKKAYLAGHHDKGNGEPVALEDLLVRTDKSEVEPHWRRRSHCHSSKSNKAARLNKCLKQYAPPPIFTTQFIFF
jgi:hypothetical protein